MYKIIKQKLLIFSPRKGNHIPYSNSAFTPSTSLSAFTIVELLVVIVVIGILAAITIVSYAGISSKANVSSLQSDLSSAKKQLALYYIDHSSYPTGLSSNCPIPNDAKYCLKPSGSNTFTYTSASGSNPQSFSLVATNDTTSYRVANNTNPVPYNVTLGAVLELYASNANNGVSPGTNNPLTNTWYDTSGNGNNGTLNSFSMTDTSGWDGIGTTGDPNRLVFDGESTVYRWVSFANSTQFSTMGTTLEFWADTTKTTQRTLITFQDYDPRFCLSAGTTFDIYLNTSGSQGLATGVNLADGLLHHLVLTFDSLYPKAYVDGILRATGTQMAQTSSLRTFRIGDRAIHGATSDSSWNGSIAVARIYPFALSPAQVQQNYAAGIK